MGGDFNGANSIGGQARNRHRPARCHDRLGRFVQPEREQSLSVQSRCRRTARFWWAATFTEPSADRRAITSPGSMPPPAWLIRSIRTRTMLSFNRGAGGRQDFVGGFFNGANSIGGQPRNRIARLDATTGLADSFNPNANGFVESIAVQADGKILAGGGFSVASADRRAIASPGSIPRPAWLIRSTRTRTTLCPFNRGAGGRQDSSGRRFHAASADRRATASPGSMPPPAWLIRSTRTRTILVHSIAVQADGKILGGRLFHQHRRTAAQPFRSFD